MVSRRVSRQLALGFCTLLCVAGCKSNQYAKVIKPEDKEMVGSHQAGQETYRPLIDEAVAKLLARHCLPTTQQPQVNAQGEVLPPPKMNICFVGVENKTSEEIGDFKEQIYENIDSRLMESTTCTPISRRYVEAGLKQVRLRPDELFVPDNMRNFVGVMQQQGQPFDYLLFAKLTSGTTRENKDYQRDYLLTLEMVDLRTGAQDKQSAEISKAYYHSWASRTWSNLWAK
jgi:hypothetical protein